MQKNFLRIAPCFLAIIVDVMGFGLVYPLMTAIFAGSSDVMLPASASQHLRAFYLGLGYLLYPLFMLFGASFLGDLSDSWGRRKVLCMSMIGLVIGFGFMGIGVTMRSITALMFGRAFTGLMAGGQPIAMAATADLSTPETKAHNMSLISFVISLGVVIGPLVGGVFSDRNISADFSLSTPFYVAALLAVVAYFWVLFGLREPHHEKKPRKLSFFRPIVLFIEAFESKRIRLLAFVFLLVQIAWALYFQLSNFILSVDFHYNSAALGIFTTSIGVWFAVALFLIFPIFNKRCNIETIAIYSFVVLAIGLLLTAFIPSDIAVWILAFVAAAADIIAYSAMMTIFSNSADESSQGWVMGIFAAIISISWVISGALMNLVPVIGPHVLLAFGGVALIVGAIFMGAFKHHLES